MIVQLSQTGRLPLVLAVVVFVLMSSCDSPVAFERDNPRDPHGQTFAPSPATDLQIAVDHVGRVQLKWKDQSTFNDGYVVVRTLGLLEPDTIAWLPPDAVTFSDKVERNVFEAHYKVQVFADQDGRRNFGDQVSATAVIVDPQMISVRTQIETERRVMIQTTQSYDLPGISAILERSENRVNFVELGPFPLSGTALRDTFDFRVGEYFYRLRLESEANETAFSPARHLYFNVPTPPRPLLDDDNLDDLTIAWQQNQYAEGWIIERCSEPSGICVEIERPRGPTRYTDREASTAEEHQYRVRSLVSAYSAAIKVGHGPQYVDTHLGYANAQHLAFDRTNGLVAVRDMGFVAIREIESGRLVRRLDQVQGFRLAFSGNGAVLAAHVSEVHFIDPASGELLSSMAFDDCIPIQIALDSDASRIAVSCASKVELRVYDVESGTRLWRAEDQTSPNTAGDFTGLRFSDDDQFLSATSLLGGWIWNASDGEVRWHAPDVEYGPNTVAISSDGLHAAYIRSGGSPIIVSTADFTTTTNVKAQRVDAHSLAFKADGTEILAIGEHGGAWNVQTGDRTAYVSSPLYADPYNPGWMLPASDGTTVYHYERPTGLNRLRRIEGAWHRLLHD